MHGIGFNVRIVPGAVEVEHTVPVVQFGEGIVGTTIALQRIELPPATYAIVEIEVDPITHSAEPGTTTAALRVAEVACVMELLYRGIANQKEFEGFVSSDSMYATSWEGPLELVALPHRPVEEIAGEIAQALAILEALKNEKRSRFRLAARWFRRGCEAVNPVDKLLFWWTVLEVFPAQETTDVPRSVVNFLHANVYPDVVPTQLKSAIGIGRIFGTRSRIVHDGLAFVSDLDFEFKAQLRQLRAIAATCLRLLCGLPAGDDLDLYVRLVDK
ncbi:HEPN domain-containing protein [Methylocucumis oryzae]|nr:HEPN domain-containing protein [Methylocucumis oryzae]